MLSLWSGSDKLGPYQDADAARHQFLQSQFHRSVDFCGSCHDVSNPAVGDIAHNNGSQNPDYDVIESGVLGSPVAEKAAFNNFPFQYGIVERTYSEYKSALFSQMLVSDYASLPSDLQKGAIAKAYQTSQGNNADGTVRYFSCQTCHVPATTGLGCNKNGAPVRSDLPLHDMTGGNYWMADAIFYQDSLELLRLGGGLTALQTTALQAGQERAKQQLEMAADISINGNTLKVTNLTGHKLISGYPEGRRMWLNIKWYDGANNILREDGTYGEVQLEFDITGDGVNDTVNTLLDLYDPNSKVYESHYAMTQEWASQLVNIGYGPSLPLSYDRISGEIDMTLGQLAALNPGIIMRLFILY